MAMFKRFVEPGRLALITYGPNAGKVCSIVDIVDQKRVLVDGPQDLTGVKRHVMPIGRMSLTDLRCRIRRGARQKTLRKALEKEEILKKWKETKWCKKLTAHEAKRNMTDFERFKLMVAKKKKSKAVKKALKK
mmetsp:Transcript_6454/g.8840  ORF Transcript_6454/g.8840 Transcript_6454/m.8840 type:complete len:133 (-) Transcript_6454:63-461(-)